jgi:hypothetical protein
MVHIMRKILIISLFLLSIKTFATFTNNSPNAVIPDTIFVCENTELNIWWSSLVRGWERYKYRAYTDDGIGLCKNRCFRLWAAHSTIGDHNLTIMIYDYNTRLLQTLTTVIHVADKTTGGTGDKNILVVGNSIIDNYTYHLQLFYDSLVANSSCTPHLRGLQDAGTYPNEGYGGKSCGWFVTYATSPFTYFTTSVHFTNYWQDSLGLSVSTDKLDFVYIQLGVNDVRNYLADQTTITSVINYAKVLCDSIIKIFPNVKIMLQMCSLYSDRDGWTDDYNTSEYNDPVRYEENIRQLWATLIRTFDKGAYKSQIDVGSMGIQIDRDYGYEYANVAVSNREPTLVREATNGLHPIGNNSGNKQIGDCMLGQFMGKIK